MSMDNPCKEFGGDSNLYVDVEGRNFNTEVWFANLLSELIRRGIDSDEHHHFKDSPLGGSYSPNLEELKKVNLGLVGEFLTPLLQKHLDDIVEDYQKAEKNNER
jgi:hypothetical protein